MGLDITAYSHLQHLGKHEAPEDDDEYCYNHDHVAAYAYSAFPRSFAGLEGADEEHVVRSTTFIGGHCYVPTPKTETHGFRAGSYSGYGMYRSALSGIFLGISRDENTKYWETVEKQTHAPFYELVNFADNEGCIGPIAAEKLYHDHVNGREQFFSEYPDYKFLYDDWTRAFDLARHDGLVRFH